MADMGHREGDTPSQWLILAIGKLHHPPNGRYQPSGCARTAVFDRWSDGHCPTEARANWSDRFVRPVPAGPVQPVPGTDRTGLSDPPAGASVGQCLSDHRSNTAVRAPLELPCSTG
ncbi:hypothetical protein PCANC_02164 [Puccinia coronata f. sp. avenae]|uniref:Uncharacterized protein n=1 Tax=Puccinia coronata f. sp. avenae TaxID=200324 RepID=A0A2N5VZZ7_9BASI|nr:hypothetical protein PCANC_02164 [Puccinia coronata f. sp. avenae]